MKSCKTRSCPLCWVDWVNRQANRSTRRFVKFTEDIESIGTRLNQAQAAHAQAVTKLSSGSGNLINRAEKLRQLGVKTTKKLSRDLSENDDTDLIEDDDST